MRLVKRVQEMTWSPILPQVHISRPWSIQILAASPSYYLYPDIAFTVCGYHPPGHVTSKYYWWSWKFIPGFLVRYDGPIGIVEGRFSSPVDWCSPARTCTVFSSVVFNRRESTWVKGELPHPGARTTPWVIKAQLLPPQSLSTNLNVGLRYDTTGSIFK